VGSGEAMNEVPAGMSWPGTAEQLERTEEALTIIVRLLDGETVDHEGRFFRTRGARLYDRPARRPPVFVSAFHEQVAEVAGRLADGVWTLADPLEAPKIIAAYRRGAEQAGRDPGEIILQSLASVAASDEAALEGSREWKPSRVDELYTADIHEPADNQSRGDEVSDGQFTRANLVSSDPETHVHKLQLLGELGATAVVVMNASGADPDGMIGLYGSSVLPRLRGD
jgi:coenzyme F420-dependent glucose-6-phosphate dehydrogenase